MIAEFRADFVHHGWVTAVLHVVAEDWTNTRFVRSRLWETGQALRVLLDPKTQQLHRAWLAGLDAPLLLSRLPILVALNPASGFVPDFLVPAPHDGLRGIDEELALVAGHPPETVAAELRRSLASRPTARRAELLQPLIADPAAALHRIVAELELAWRSLLEPSWHRIDEVVSADIGHRGAQMTRRGLGAALTDLSADVLVEGGRICVQGAEKISVELAGRGLALMPSAFVWPRTVVVHDGGWPPTLAYPARGVAAMWAAPPPPADSLAVLLGRTRARLLADLAEDRSTGELARRHSLAPGTVSEHLFALHGAGLLTRRRERREVRYRRSPLGDQLVRGTASSIPTA